MPHRHHHHHHHRGGTLPPTHHPYHYKPPPYSPRRQRARSPSLLRELPPVQEIPEIRRLNIRYLALNHKIEHEWYGVPIIRNFRVTNHRGVEQLLPGGKGVVSRANVGRTVREKLGDVLQERFKGWRYIGAEKPTAGPCSSRTPDGYSQRELSVWIQRRE